MDEAIPAEAEVRVLSEVMDDLDWSRLESSCSELGFPAYPPREQAKRPREENDETISEPNIAIVRNGALGDAGGEINGKGHLCRDEWQ